ncbi:IclR family transcriptional regulator [Streptomyces antimycoticus]|uniref:IclR family transcriptional regulator n=1 Tax=Streptomyces antimycoticus TaxID=68175 RepID=UPI000A3B9DCB|nr:IclR family transcriptional regulator [Streptomyces antimycoticus]
MQVIVRALSVLRLLARTPGGLTLGALAERLEMPIASAHRVVGVLEEERFVARSPTNRRYFLGPAVREMLQPDGRQQSLLVQPHEALVEAASRTGETVFLSEMVGNKVVCLTLAESQHPLRLFVRVGQEMPLNAAAAARVLLAWRDADAVRRMLASQRLVPFTKETPVGVEEIIAHLQKVRERGYDVCESELEANVWAVAAPVRSSIGEVVASVTLAAPAQRVTDAADRDEAFHAVIKAADRMAADLGWVASTG